MSVDTQILTHLPLALCFSCIEEKAGDTGLCFATVFSLFVLKDYNLLKRESKHLEKKSNSFFSTQNVMPVWEGKVERKGGGRAGSFYVTAVGEDASVWFVECTISTMGLNVCICAMSGRQELGWFRVDLYGANIIVTAL